MEILAYDGTFNGFLSILLYLLKNPEKLSHTQVINLRIEKNLPFLFTHFLNYPQKEIKRFYFYLRKTLEPDFFKKLFLYYLCDGAKIEIHVAKAIFLSTKNSKIYKDITQEDIVKLYQAEKAYFREKHCFLGLLRFAELLDKTPPLLLHLDQNIIMYYQDFTFNFLRRLLNENFIIFDVLRNFAFLYKR